jgi:hypothetical protein
MKPTKVLIDIIPIWTAAEFVDDLEVEVEINFDLCDEQLKNMHVNAKKIMLVSARPTEQD